MKKLLILCSSWMYEKPRSENWEVFCNIQEKDPRYSISEKFGLGYIRVIRDIKPDFVLAINVGCSERRFDLMPKPKGLKTKYITWSTDSYRHTKRAETSDLHLTSIPDKTMKPGDNFVPLFSNKNFSSIPFKNRAYKYGIHCRKYHNQNEYRQKHLECIKRHLKKELFINQKNLAPLDYIEEISKFKYGINIGTYDDGLPNFRSFEYGMLGIMPISSSVNREVLENLFEDNILIYDHPEEISGIVSRYDPSTLKKFFSEKHTLQKRLEYIFKTYFDIDFC